ncbi:NUDIX domain-containing protein [Patescibacteria group bacterium]|nr:NUDIX domain-containing protein [Patescibacteria group bacterium]MBU1755272.1 NUDIX domain-containing protein [Patescibacteria group bacterium]
MATPTPVHNELHRIATTGIIWKEEGGTKKYLITKRAPHKKVWPNKWTVPGGGLEVSDYINADASHQNTESPQWYNVLASTLKREIAEEVGVDVEEGILLQHLAFIRPDGIAVLVFSFYCKYVGGEVKLDEDATEFAWITADEAKDYDFIQGIDEEIRITENKLNA